MKKYIVTYKEFSDDMVVIKKSVLKLKFKKKKKAMKKYNELLEFASNCTNTCEVELEKSKVVTETLEFSEFINMPSNPKGGLGKPVLDSGYPYFFFPQVSSEQSKEGLLNGK